MMNIFSQTGDALRRLIRLLSSPVKRDYGRGGLYILPYRGYGNASEIFLMGRVFRQSPRGRMFRSGMGRDLLDILRRLHRRGVANAVLRARFEGAEKKVSTDVDGYFRISLHPDALPVSDRFWHTVDLDLVDCGDEASRAAGPIFIPPRRARFVVISDIDDTVMFTGVASKIMMAWRLFFQGAKSRIAFPGVGAFYRALHDGEDPEGGTNPILYVSRGPWGLYEVLDHFFHLHRIPVGPILFLREWGVSWRSPLPRKASGHKRDLIEKMLAIYPDLPFVLIGDSGQHDPEIYARVVEDHPERVLAVYIRNVSRNRSRIAEIEQLADRMSEAGSPLLLAADSFAMAEHAAAHGLIDASALREVVRERRAQREGRAPRQPIRKLKTQEEQQRGGTSASRRAGEAPGDGRSRRSAAQYCGGAATGGRQTGEENRREAPGLHGERRATMKEKASRESRQENEDGLKREEMQEVISRTAPRAVVVHEAIRREGREELRRSPSALAWSGLAAGLSMGFSMVADGLIHAHLPEAPWRPLLAKFGYSIGFLIVILGRQQLFTENTLTPILPLLHKTSWPTFTKVLRLWTVVLAANLAGTFLFALTVVQGEIFDPHIVEAFAEIGRESLTGSFGVIFLRAIFAGWLIALTIWLLPFAETARVGVIIIITYLIGIAGFNHIIAGSVEIFLLSITGELSWGEATIRFFLPTLTGNVVGGIALVAAVNHAQVVAGGEPADDVE